MKNDLSRLQPGESAPVGELRAPEPLRRRLLELGFTPGTAVSCLFAAPGGDPRAYLVRRSVVALRAADARGILLRAPARVSPAAEKNGGCLAAGAPPLRPSGAPRMA
ncbi:MAG: FeoA family protein [Clostridia bacterium]|nr:FeoA family protein [Clostridia bacterium]